MSDLSTINQTLETIKDDLDFVRVAKSINSYVAMELKYIKDFDPAYQMLAMNGAMEDFIKKAIKDQELKLEAANELTDSRLRLKRFLGGWLKQNLKHGGDRKSSSNDGNLKMSDLGIDKHQSSEFQAIASIPEEEFEQAIAETKTEQKELTSAQMLKLAKDVKARESYEEKREELIPDSANHILADVRRITLEQLGSNPFRAIVLDPAWEFEAWDQKTGDGKSPEYDLMTLDDVYNLPITQLADSDCVLFLWVTNPFLPHALKAMETWGFSYRTKFPWIKTTLKNQMLDYGTGYWVRGVSEDVLIGTRGNIKAPRRENFLGLIGPNIEHSRKPQDIYKMAESTTPGPYLELFARYSQPNWITVGNEYRGEKLPDPIPSPNPPWLKIDDEAS